MPTNTLSSLASYLFRLQLVHGNDLPVVLDRYDGDPRRIKDDVGIAVNVWLQTVDGKKVVVLS